MADKNKNISVDELAKLIAGPIAFFKCAMSGFITAVAGIGFERVPVQHQPGKLFIVSHAAKEIDVNIDLTRHVTTLDTKAGPGPDQKMLLRIPIGVKFFEVPLATPGMARTFFFQSSDGYNTMPLHLARGDDTAGGQTVQELILVTSHVPPRIDPKGVSGVRDVPILTDQELQALLKPDVPA
jgi:hypothetical protein